MSAVSVELIVQAFQHIDDHKRRGGAAYGRESNDITKQHSHLLMRFRFDGFA